MVRMRAEYILHSCPPSLPYCLSSGTWNGEREGKFSVSIDHR
jgi:hypothetical protein